MDKVERRVKEERLRERRDQIGWREAAGQREGRRRAGTLVAAAPFAGSGPMPSSAIPVRCQQAN